MNKYEAMENSIMKNIQELSEFVVNELHVNNYYDFIDVIIDLYNFRAKTYKNNKKLALDILKEIEKENKEN